jgi:hypothetical protein
MMDSLVSLAEVTNLITCVGVIIALALFFIRFAGDDFLLGDSGVQKFKHVPPRVDFAKILLPFRIQLLGIKEPYRIHLELTSQCGGRMRVYWGVDINAFHQVIRAPEDWFTQAFFHGNLFGQGKCMEMSEIQPLQQISQGLVPIQKPSDKPLHLGSAPRDIYPCVVVMVNQESALLSAIHIKDNKCMVPSQILAEYYKCGSRATLLHQIFISNSDIGENSDTESQEDTETEDYAAVYGSDLRRRRVARCVVCQEHKISRVILPCRHAASCYSCFNRLEHCPMCRGFIQSYFLIAREPQSNNSQSPMDEEGRPGSTNQGQQPQTGHLQVWRTRLANLAVRIRGPHMQNNF